MLIDNKKLSEARLYISRLSEGKDPVTKKKLNDSLDNPEVIRVMFYVKELLDKIAEGELISKEKSPFPYEILLDYEYSEDLSITSIIKKICDPVKGENIKMPSPQMAGAWLREEGYLTIEFVDELGIEAVVPTKKGMELGIYSRIREFQGRKFPQIFYSRPAQEFIVNNFDKLLNYRKSGK